MFDAALIQQCADPGLEIAIVERFLNEAGSDNPLSVRITAGNKIILPEPPRTPDEAVSLIQRFVGEASVRVGITNYPAGYGVSDAAQITADIVDACTNIRMGTALFGKVYRIVAHAQDGTGRAVFSAAIQAWQSGAFEGRYVFGVPDPGPLPVEQETPQGSDNPAMPDVDDLEAAEAGNETAQSAVVEDPHKAGIRIDLSGIGKSEQ